MKLTSSSTRSMTVCRRRAPMFSTEAFTCTATLASAFTRPREVERHGLVSIRA